MLEVRETVDVAPIEVEPGEQFDGLVSGNGVDFGCQAHQTFGCRSACDDVSDSLHGVERVTDGRCSVRWDESVESQHCSRFVSEEQVIAANEDQDARHPDPQWEHQTRRGGPRRP